MTDRCDRMCDRESVRCEKGRYSGNVYDKKDEVTRRVLKWDETGEVQEVWRSMVAGKESPRRGLVDGREFMSMMGTGRGG